MNELTLEQLRFARAIGATHYLLEEFYKPDTNQRTMFYVDGLWVLMDTVVQLSNSKWDEDKINFAPLDEAKQPDPQADMVNKPRNKYMREIKPGVWVDVYDVIQAWKVTNSAQQHLIKKALQGGQRGHKDYETDMRDIMASATRAIELDRAAQELGK